MDKFYRVKKDNFLWKEGAILKYNSSGQHGGYDAIEDIWNNSPAVTIEYISAPIIECPNNQEYFERVYPDSIAGKIFKTKDKMIELYTNNFIS